MRSVWRRNDYPRAFVFGLKAQAVNQVVLDQVMDVPSEELKIKYLTIKEQSLHTFLSLVSQHMPGQAQAVKSASRPGSNARGWCWSPRNAFMRA